MLIRVCTLVMGLAVLLSLTQCNSLDNLFNENSSTTTTRTPRSNTSSSETRLRQNIIDFALDQEGARYKYGGRSPRTGFDCSGFTHYVMDNFGIELTPVSRAQEGEGQRISIDEARAGDLVFFRRSRTGPVFHVALVISNDRDGLQVVHSTSSRGVIVQNIAQNSYWTPKLSTARRVIR